MSGWIDRNGWIHCPTCGNKTRTKVNPDTVLKHFPLFCPKCGKEHIVDVQGQSTWNVASWEHLVERP